MIHNFCINLQILGVSDRAEKDEIVKSVMHLKNAEVEDGYTMDAVVSRQVVAAILHIQLSYRAYLYSHAWLYVFRIF